jgi:hypothetical protein
MMNCTGTAEVDPCDLLSKASNKEIGLGILIGSSLSYNEKMLYIESLSNRTVFELGGYTCRSRPHYIPKVDKYKP